MAEMEDLFLFLDLLFDPGPLIKTVRELAKIREVLEYDDAAELARWEDDGGYKQVVNITVDSRP